MPGLDNTTALRFGRFELQTTERQLLVNGQPTKIGARAFDVLLTLIEHRARLITKKELLSLVWPGLVVEENNLQVHISTLRKILGPGYITTIVGRGYRFSAALEPASAGLTSAAAQSIQPATSPHNLPTPRDRFIGRTDVLAQCAELLQHSRLLTLIGIGGCGKTRLATQLARQQLEHFPGGVWLVDLAPTSSAAPPDEHPVALAIAMALGVHEEAATPILRRIVLRAAS